MRGASPFGCGSAALGFFFSSVDVKFQVSLRSRHEHSDSRSTALAVSMMDNDLDLRDFANVTRLFPLPNLVMFPHVVLPLHIFEPRYRQMTEDALAGDRLITMVQITPPARGEHSADSNLGLT